ncbi:molybdenum cofactor biosynthesis protein MoaA [Methyloceanibacter marginalis]|uniref:Molybdopterin molybdenumtransferase n=1 Tax=Methyloceanibacter marginalis TaxID=1774971 RepID=A0A1E3W8W7_9HYPH|nr:gephyrin-like molybdotransferase Glp [Methyloceanibacter marginalis]ODS02190.1 molybdenum cofactor biosynthesis protein MoaA [Methyloceanibacter marginalis]
MALLSVDDALALVLKGLAPLDVEQVSLADAQDRVLAEDLAATLTQPPFDASAMDGYAVRSADVAALPATLEVVGEAAAGARFTGTMKPGQAVRIFTGAPVPDGADTVVTQEDTEGSAARVVVKAAASAGKHIRPRGQDFKQGEVLLRQGTTLGPAPLMLAASMNHAVLPVRRRPQVAILATGDEVMPPGSGLGQDQIVSSAGYGVAAAVAAHGGEAVALGIARDDPESIATLAGTGAGADILVTIGGASVGERDLVASALEREGLVLEFAKVAMRPGKPVLFGRLGTQRVLGLPGNPVSALLCTYVFLVPMLRAMLGVHGDGDPVPEAVLGADLPANGERQHYLRATSTWREDGTRVVRPLPSQDSSLVAALAQADCLIVQVPHAPAAPQGARVKILPLSG